MNIGTLDIKITASSANAIKSMKQTQNAMSATTKEVLRAESALKKYYGAQARGLTLSSQSTKHMQQLEATYTKAGGKVKHLREQTAGMYDQWGRTGALGKANAALNSLRWSMVNIAFAGAAIAALGAPFALITGHAITMETAMANVSKTTNLTDEALANLKEELYDITKILPVTAKELAEIARVAGQLGIQEKNIASFSRTIAMVASVTDLTAEEAATSFAKLANAFNIPIARAIEMANVVNELENTTAANTKNIIASLSRIGAAATQLGVSYEFASAASATLIASGMRAERAGTRLRSLFVDMSKNVEGFAKLANMSIKDFANLLETDADRAILAVVKGLSEIESKTDRNAKSFEVAGKVGGFALSTLATNVNNLNTNLGTVNTQLEKNNSVIKEMSKFLDTTNVQWIIFKNQVISGSKGIGEALNENVINPILKVANALITGESAYSRYQAAHENAINEFKRGSITGRQMGIIDETAADAINRGDWATAALIVEELTRNYNNLNVEMAELDNAAGEAEDSVTSLNKALSDALGFEILLASGLELKKLELQKTFLSWTDRLVELGIATDDNTAKLREWLHEQTILEASTDIINKNIESWTQEQERLNKSLLNEKNILSELNVELKTHQKELNELLNKRFAGQTEAEEQIYAVERALKQEQLRLLELEGTAESTGSSLNSMNNEYSAWVDTIKTFIREAISGGDDLGRNVTGVVKTFQTKLLGLSLSTGIEKDVDDTNTAMTDMEKQLEILRLKYDLSYGDMTHQVELAKTLHQEEANTVAKGSAQIISALQTQWSAIDIVTDSIENQEGVIAGWSEQVQIAKDEIIKLKNELKNLQSQMTTTSTKSSSGLSKAISSGAKSYGGATIVSNVKVGESVGGGWVRSAAIGGRVTNSGLLNVHKGETIKPANITQPFNSNMDSGTTVGDINVTVNGDGSNNSEQLGREIAQQIRAELRRI